MQCQKDKFLLDDQVVYLNGAYMSPSLSSVEKAGMEGIKKKRIPSRIKSEDFFSDVDAIRDLFCQLIHAQEPNRAVLIPSASYGISNIAHNLPQNGRKKIILLGDQFPSNYYIWLRVAHQRSLEVVQINRPKNDLSWSHQITSAIDDDTLAVAMAPIHWSDGYTFDIKGISDKCKSKGSLFILDGTQFIGAHPYNHEDINPDALIVPAYKWLLGPYAIGMAYYGKAFDNGYPIEESWLNKVNSENFQYLTEYQEGYRSGARRYEMGEAPDFIKIPMMAKALGQLIEWSPAAIQQYCSHLISPLLDVLSRVGYKMPHRDHMSAHIFGIGLPDNVSLEQTKRVLEASNISVSYRGEVIRVSPSVYNTTGDIEVLTSILKDLADRG